MRWRSSASCRSCTSASVASRRTGWPSALRSMTISVASTQRQPSPCGTRSSSWRRPASPDVSEAMAADSAGRSSACTCACQSAGLQDFAVWPLRVRQPAEAKRSSRSRCQSATPSREPSSAHSQRCERLRQSTVAAWASSISASAEPHQLATATCALPPVSHGDRTLTTLPAVSSAASSRKLAATARWPLSTRAVATTCGRNKASTSTVRPCLAAHASSTRVQAASVAPAMRPRHGASGCKACSTLRSKASTATAAPSMPRPRAAQPEPKTVSGRLPALAVSQAASASAAGSAAASTTARASASTSPARSSRESKAAHDKAACADSAASTRTTAPAAAVGHGRPSPSSATKTPAATPASTGRPQRQAAAMARPPGSASAFHGLSARLKVPA